MVNTILIVLGVLFGLGIWLIILFVFAAIRISGKMSEMEDKIHKKASNLDEKKGL